jgi:general stress protein 26
MNKRNEFLKEQKILRFATVGKNKAPHVVPVWYRYNGKKFYIGTNTKTVKAKNVKKNSQVSCCVDVGINAPNIYGVLVKGNANLILESNKVKIIAKKILLRYFKSLDDESARALLDDTNCIIEVVPEEFTVWNY